MTAEPLSGAALWTAKLIGAGAGSAISVAYLLPAGRREAAGRIRSKIGKLNMRFV